MTDWKEPQWQAHKRYEATEKAKDRQRRYELTEEAKEKRRARQRLYLLRKKGLAE